MYFISCYVWIGPVCLLTWKGYSRKDTTSHEGICSQKKKGKSLSPLQASPSDFEQDPQKRDLAKCAAPNHWIGRIPLLVLYDFMILWSRFLVAKTHSCNLTFLCYNYVYK